MDQETRLEGLSTLFYFYSSLLDGRPVGGHVAVYKWFK